MGNSQPRMRTPPEQRFAGPEHLIDLDAIAEQIKAEHPPEHGHWQMVIFRRGGMTLALYCFEAGGSLREHTADGLMTIQPLDKPMVVHTPQQTHEVAPGQLVTLDPGVPHDVQAAKGGRMLLTVCRGV